MQLQYFTSYYNINFNDLFTVNNSVGDNTSILLMGLALSMYHLMHSSKQLQIIVGKGRK